MLHGFFYARSLYHEFYFFKVYLTNGAF